jgi:hypothetical protein
MKRSNNRILDYYKNLSNYWDTKDGTTGIEELEEVEIEADQNIKSYVLSGQELILYLQGFLDLKQVQQIKRIAEKKKMSVQSQVRQWILQGIESEFVNE